LALNPVGDVGRLEVVASAAAGGKKAAVIRNITVSVKAMR
jgi:hypothetical protein